jgi:hypothetical protein
VKLETIHLDDTCLAFFYVPTVHILLVSTWEFFKLERNLLTMLCNILLCFFLLIDQVLHFSVHHM